MSATGATPTPAPALIDAMSWLDARVRDVTGRRLGRVSAVVADAKGTPWWIVLRHRGHDVVAPVASVQGTRHQEVLLDRPAETLVPCPAELDEGAHEALVARFGLEAPGPSAAPHEPRVPRGDCAPRRRCRFLRRSA